MSKLKKLFGDKRIVGLAGEKSSGKTNNLAYLIKQFRNTNKETPIYVYGMPQSIMDQLKIIGVKEISSLRHLVRKKDCILIIDEFQKLRLNDRRNKETLDQFIDFVYHNNVYVLFSSPNIREFNSIIGSAIERWALKTVRSDLCVNGSQLKKAIQQYHGRYKTVIDRVHNIEIPKNELVILNDDEEMIIVCDYVAEFDTKKDLINVFKNVTKKV